MCFWVTKDTRGAIWTFGRMYARSGGRTLLFVVRMYNGGPPNIHSTNRTGGHTWDHRTYATFWNTLWLLPGRTRQPLDSCVIVPNVRPFGRTSITLPGELSVALSYKYLYPSTFFTSFQTPLGCWCEFPKCCECFVSVCEVFVCLETFMRQNPCDFVSKG